MEPPRPEDVSSVIASPIATEGPTGLTSEEARLLLARHGPNRLVPEKRRSPLVASLLGAITDPMVLLLAAAGLTYVLLRHMVDAAVTLVAVAPIVSIDLLLEARAERALEGLKRMTAPTAAVLRDGERKVVSAEQVVPTDVVFLQEGDIVPADGTFVEGSNVMVDESALTGESQPVVKDAAGTGDQLEAYAGTTVLSGRGLMRVTATGTDTRYGRIGTLVAGISQTSTPLQRLIGRLVRKLALVALVFCTAVLAIELARGDGWGHGIIAGVSLGIAAVPEEFPMVFALYLALGAWRLARGRALIRRLAGVETLGSTTVICTDKTGTLTLGRQEIAGLVTDEGFLKFGDRLPEPARTLLTSTVLASEPDPFDPLERAIVRYAESEGVDVAALHGRRLLHDYPFDPLHKYISHVWSTGHGYRIFAKGAIEGILAQSVCEPETARAALEANRQLAGRGMRVLAVAAGELAEPTGDRAADESALRYLGLVAFTDPIRPGVVEALRECREAGVRVIMITGDHPETAHAVAHELDLPHDEEAEIPTGDLLDEADDETVAAHVRTANLFARTRPENKHRLIRALKAQGEVVAMTGDGINDAPALREADIGVAMGQRGTEVAREAATMVLLDDNFATIVGAVRDGRRIFENLRRAFSYLIAFHVPLLLGALLAPLVGAPLLFLPIHLVLLELILHPTISLVFENDPPPPDLMRRPPRRPGAALITGREWLRPFALGLTLTAGVLALYLSQISRNVPVPDARALAFSTLLLGQMLLVLVERSPRAPIWRTGLRGNRALPLLLASILTTLMAVVYVPGLARLLHVAPLSLGAWALAVGVAAATTLWHEPVKALLVGRRDGTPA
jgi:Ca2+-transporting ATPase